MSEIELTGEIEVGTSEEAAYARTNSRIDNIIAHNNDSEGNSELIDIRTGADGTVYASAGTAVREQIETVSDTLARLNRSYVFNLIPLCTFVNGTISVSENHIALYNNTSNRIRTGVIDINDIVCIDVTVPENKKIDIFFLDNDGSTLIQHTGWINQNTEIDTSSYNKCVILVSNADDRSIFPTDIEGLIFGSTGSVFRQEVDRQTNGLQMYFGNSVKFLNSLYISPEIINDNPGNYLNTGNSIHEISGVGVSDFYPCSPGDTLAYTLSGSNYYALIAAYDKHLNYNGAKVTGSGWEQLVSGTVTFGENDYCFRVCGIIGKISQYSLEYGSVPEKVENMIETAKTVAVSESVQTAVSSSVSSAIKEDKAFCYLASGKKAEYNVGSNTCELKIPYDLIITYNNVSKTFTQSAVLAAAQNSSFVTVENETISGNTFCMVYDKENETISFVSASAARTTDKYLILFYHHYSSTNFGLLVDYMNMRKIYSLESSLSAIETELGNREDESLLVPDYWETMLASKENTVKQALQSAGKNKSAFIFLTDTHWGTNRKHSPAIINHIMNNTPVKMTVFGGDIITNVSADKADMLALGSEWQNAFKFCKDNFYCVYGNHDANSNSQTVQEAVLSEEEVYSYLQSQGENSNVVYGDYYYYYIDNPTEKTRYLMLDTGRYKISSGCAGFIVNALNTLPQNWHCVIVSHIFKHCRVWNDTSTCGKAALTNVLEPLIDAYNARTTGSGSFDGETISYNFTNAAGRIEFCIGGHVHFDTDYRTEGGIPVIMFDCDGVGTLCGTPATRGTTNEQCLTVVVADYNNNKINCIRFGRGNDQVFNIVELN